MRHLARNSAISLLLLFPILSLIAQTTDTLSETKRPWIGLEIHSTKGTPHWWYIGLNAGITFPLEPNAHPLEYNYLWNTLHSVIVQETLETHEDLRAQIVQRLGGEFEIGNIESTPIKSAFTFGASWQMQLRNHWSFEFGYQHRRHDIVATYPVYVEPSGGMEHGGEITSDLKFDQLDVSLRYRFGTGVIRPYLSAGVGWLKWRESNRQESISGISFPVRMIQRHDLVRLLLLGTGFTWQLKEKWTLDVNAKVSSLCINHLTCSVGLLYRLGTYNETSRIFRNNST